MSTWKQMISDAKDLLDMGAITQEEFEQTKREAFALRRQNMQATPSINEDDRSGETQIFTGVDTVEDELSSDTLAGTTQLVPEVEIDDMSSDPLSSDTLAGGTEFVPDYDMDAGRNDTLSGVTMMGRAVTLTDANIETLSSGTLFNNRYSILKLLGKGGMGVVYKAVDIHTGVEVALKVLRNHVKDDVAYIQSLKGEVALGLRWNHPSFLQIRHLEVESVQPFVVMELMNRDAKEWLDSHGGQVESKDVLSVIQSIAAALIVMHEDGHIHLDLKPENVLLNDKTAKLADFGISSSLKDQRGGHSGSGTLFYAPPEQIDGGQCDVRTDIYALGMMTGQLLSGRFPFDFKKVEEVQEWHRRGSRDFAYVPGKVSQVLGKACAVSIDERYRTVVEFIAELEKALDHKLWYPLSLPLESVHPSLVLVNDEEYTMDVASLLPQGVLTPSLSLEDGKVLMQSNPFALAEIGVLDYLSSNLQPVVEDILSGSDSKLSGLSKQDSTTESQLAMLASRAELSDRTVQRRLYYASDSLEYLEDRLTLAYTHRMAMKDVKSANDLMESIQPGDIFDRLEVARHQRWLELDQRAVQRKMFAIEEDCKTSEDWEEFASAQVSLFGDWSSVDTELTRANQQPSNLERAIEILQEQVNVYGLRNPLKEAGNRLENLAESTQDYAKIAEFWKMVGVGDAASKAEEERQALFRSTIQSLVQRLVKLDAHIDPPTGTLSESDVVGYERKVGEQERLHGDVADLKRKLAKTDVSLDAPSGVLTDSQVNVYKEQASEQVGLYQHVQEMKPIARSLNLEDVAWTRPYTAEQVSQRREEVATYAEYAEQMETMLATANQLGWDVSQSGLVEAENVSTFAEQLAQQQRLSEQLGKLRAEAEALGGTLVLPEYPLTPQKIAGVEAQMPSVRVESDVREQVSLAKSIGWDLEMPEPPYTLDLVEDLREQVQEQRRFKVACENRWDLKHPSFPMTQDAVEAFKDQILEQAAWNGEIEVLYKRSQIANRPKPPYSPLEVETYRQDTNAMVFRRRVKGWTGIVICVLAGVMTFRWNTAQKFKYNLNMMGCYPDLPMFGHSELYRLQFSLNSRGYSDECRSFDFEKFMELQSLLTVKQIPSGTFTMGCTSEQSDCDSHEKPTHKVTISQDFVMMETETTQHLYETVMGYNPSLFKGANRPVEMVSWFDAVKFANKLSGLDGRSKCYSINYDTVKLFEDCTGWRLPTEAEWEYAARGGQSYKYAGSDSVGNVTWYADNSKRNTHPVGLRKSNGFGLYDMSGNVSEWVWDWKGLASREDQKDPLGPRDGSRRIFRGGGFLSDVNETRISYRWHRDPSDEKSFLGFRLVRSDYKNSTKSTPSNLSKTTTGSSKNSTTSTPSVETTTNPNNPNNRPKNGKKYNGPNGSSTGPNNGPTHHGPRRQNGPKNGTGR